MNRLFVCFILSSQLPSGCPEQTFYSFIPNIAAMWYLNSTGNLTENDKHTTTRHIEVGYQKIMSPTLRDLDDGSFSFWSEKSVWLTAYITKVLAHIKTLMAVDAKPIEMALQYLMTQENEGSFTERGMSAEWGASRNIYGIQDDSLSAFVAIAFLESKSSVGDFSQFAETVNRTLNSHCESRHNRG